MGAFQGIAAGLGSAGEDFSKGELGANQIALNQAALQHQWSDQDFRNNIAQQQLALQQSGQKQVYDLAQQQHDLMRMQLMNSGREDMGPVMDAQGNYSRNMFNKQTGQVENYPLAKGQVPPDSAEGMMRMYGMLGNMKDQSGQPMFTDLQAKQVAFKMPQLYREGPAGIYEGFQDEGKNRFPSDPGQAQKFGQKLWDEYILKSGYPRMIFGYPNAAGNVPGAAAGYMQDVLSGNMLLSGVPAAMRGQVEAGIHANGQSLPAQLPPSVKIKAEQTLDSINNALLTIGDIQKDSDLLNNLPTASLVDLAQSQSGIKALAGKAANFFGQVPQATQDRVDRLASNMNSLKENINIIRSPIGATGFRGAEGWDALQAQVANAMAQPGVTANNLAHTAALLNRYKATLQSSLGGAPATPVPTQSQDNRPPVPSNILDISK